MSGIEIGAGALGTLLLGVIGYFLKTRDKRLGDVEKQAENTGKDVAVITSHLDTISKRLGAGAESFKEISNTQKQLQENQTHIVTHFVQKREYEKDQDKHEHQHDRTDRTIEGIKESVADMKETVRGIDQKLEGGIQTMTSMLAKVVTIPKDPGDCE